MKKKELKKTLSLKKEVIANLQDDKLDKIKGGATEPTDVVLRSRLNACPVGSPTWKWCQQQ